MREEIADQIVDLLLQATAVFDDCVLGQLVRHVLVGREQEIVRRAGAELLATLVVRAVRSREAV